MFIEKKYKNLLFFCDKDRLYLLFVIPLLVIGRLFIQIMLYRSGFISLTADEFGRTVAAAQWAQNPHMVWNGVWLPFHMYMIGIALQLKWELLYVPRIITICFGFASILVMFKLTEQLFNSRLVGLISAFLLSVNPVHIWLSSTPLTAIPYATFILTAVLSLVFYFKNEEKRYMYLGAIILLIANGFRYEAWVFSLLFSITLVGYGCLTYSYNGLDIKYFPDLILGMFIPWLIPFFWVVGNYIGTGNPVFFSEVVRMYKLTWYGGGVDYTNYLTVFFFVDPYAVVLVCFGVLFCLIHFYKKSWVVWWYVMMSVIPPVLFIYLHGGQVEPQGNYLRYLAFFVFFSYPIVSFLISFVLRFEFIVFRLRVFLLFVALGLIGVTQIYSTFQFVNDPAAEGVAVGQRIRSLRMESPKLIQRPVLIELSYWQYLAIHVGANDVTSIIYDREVDLENRESQSLLMTDLEGFTRVLENNKVGYIVVSSQGLREIIESKLGLIPEEQVNGYFFYEVGEEITIN